MARFGRAQKASALLPLAVLSAAWTAGLATAGSSSSAAAGPDSSALGTRVPSRTVREPASLMPSHALDRGIAGRVHRAVETAAASGIPEVALTAYLRAATVIDAADSTCHLPWQLVAAIGRVESDHGRARGSALTDRGIDRPAVFGPRLDGRHGTVVIEDTDAGRYDHDARFDRAMGPMQFIPSTWAIVGVDADNDGRRDPQDVYDAALAATVYLCSGPDDLSTAAGQRSAVFRYNHSRRYVALVLAIEKAYTAGGYAAVPDSTTSTGFSLADPPAVDGDQGRHRQHHGHHSPGGDDPTQTPSTTPPAGPTHDPSQGPTTGPTAGPTQQPSGILPTKLPALPTLLPTSILPSVVPSLLTTTQAILQCLAQGLLQGTHAFSACVDRLTGGS
jgi:membrane-bound lytic murein transglycosylase B